MPKEKMQALVLEGKEDFQMREVEKPACPKDGLLVKVDSVGLCGSDVRTYFHGHHHIEYPVILGHENVGEIVEVGEEVENFVVGDRIIVNPVLPCNQCWYCKKGWQHMCSDRLTYGHHIQGGFAEYMAVPGIGLERGQVLKLPDGAASEDFVIVELLSSVVSAQEYANVTLGETVVIIGAGPIGCLHAEIAKVRGAKEIIIVDINEKRLEMAKQFSVSKTILSSEINPVEQVLQWTEGFGADVVICATPVASTQSQGIDMLRKRGRLVIFGGVSAENPFTTLDSNKIHYNELAVMGAFAYGPVNFQKAFDLVAGKSIHTDGFITNIIPLQDVEKGIKAIRAGDALKVVMKPGQTS